MKNKVFKLFNRGFTIVELLAVIIILAIVLAIAVPKVLSVLEESQKEALKLSAKNIEKSARENAQSSLMTNDITYTIENGEFVDKSIPLIGRMPNNGTVIARKDGTVGLALSNGKFCLTKSPDDDEMIITKDTNNCVLIIETPSTCFYYDEVGHKEIEIEGYNKFECPSDVVIPKKLDGYTVVGIGEGAFSTREGHSLVHKENSEYNTVAYNGLLALTNDPFYFYNWPYGEFHRRDEFPITSVIIPNTVRYIEKNAFKYNLLKTVTIPERVKFIGQFAFEYNELTNINILSSSINIETGAFNDNLLPDNQAFIYARNLDGSINNTVLISYGGIKKDNVILPSSIKIIGEYAFSNSKLNNLIIPNTVEQIKSNAFYNNNIRNIEIPGGIALSQHGISYSFYLTYNDYYNKLPGSYSASCQDCTWKHSTQPAPPIPTSCFIYESYGPSKISIYDYDSNCPKDLIIPSTIEGNTVANIGSSAFYNMNLVSVSLPNTIERIERGSFEKNQLTSITIPNSVTYIGETAFSKNQLTSLVIPSSVLQIGSESFMNNNLTSLTLNNGLRIIGSYAFQNNQITSLVIPNSVELIGNDSFYNNKLANLVLGTGIYEIGYYAFAKNQLTNITMPSNITWTGAAIFNDNQLPANQAFIYKRNPDGSIDNTRITSYGGAKKDNVVIPNGVTRLEYSSFRETNLMSVTLPNTLEVIGSSAFQYNLLTSINIPNSLHKIESGAFAYNRLTSLVAPNVTRIEYFAFPYNQITNVTLSNNLNFLGPSAFFSNNITTLTIPNGLDIIQSNAFAQNKITELVIPNNITYITTAAFASNQLKKITIPSNVNVVAKGYQIVPSISDSFYTSYVTENNKEGGVYTAPSQDGVWTKQP